MVDSNSGDDKWNFFENCLSCPFIIWHLLNGIFLEQMEEDDDEEPKIEGLEKMDREEIEARVIELFVL